MQRELPHIEAPAREGRALEWWIPAIYAAVSAVWITISDAVIATSGTASEQTVRSTVKGLAFVLVTSALLHLLLRSGLARQRASHARLVQLAGELRASDARKDRLIAMLSHELRNPLAALQQALWLLERAPEDGERAGRARETIGRQLLHLSRLTDDLVDSARLSLGKVRLQPSRVDLVDVVRGILSDHELLLRNRELELVIRLTSLPLWVDGDAVRLGQALVNLLSNAAKFTPSGGRVEVVLERGAEGQAVLRVIDEGVGMTAEVAGQLFEPFYQADTSLDRSGGGLGLGLAVVRAIAELHGGGVAVRSDGPGRGAEFTVTLPLAQEAPALRTVTRAPPRAGRGARSRRVLVIEDNLDAAESLRDLLSLWDHDVEVAHDGLEGLERARRFRPDLVLCDLGLPGIDGYEVARRLRADPALASTFLVAVTGYASPEDARRAQAAGFDRHLGKPVPVERVAEVLATSPGAGVLH